MDTRNQRQLKHQGSPQSSQPQKPFSLPKTEQLLTRKVLDERYLIHRTIGEGRYAK